MKSKESRVKQCYDVLDDEMSVVNYFYNSLLEKANKRGFKEVELTSIENSEKFEKVASVVSSKIFEVRRKKEGSIYSLKSDIAISTARFISEFEGVIPILKLIEISKLYRDRVDDIPGYRREFKQILLSTWGSNDLFYDAELLKLVLDTLNDVKLSNSTYTQISNQNIFNSIQDGLASKIRFFGIDELKKTNISNYDFHIIKDIYDDKRKLDIKELKELSTLLKNEKIKNEIANMMDIYFYLKLLKYNSKILFSIDNLDGTNHYSGMNYRIYSQSNDKNYLLADGGRINNMVNKFNANKNIPAVCLGIGAGILAQNVQLETKKKNINLIIDSIIFSEKIDLINNIIEQLPEYNVNIVPYNLKKIKKFYKSEIYMDSDYIILNNSNIDVRTADIKEKENLKKRIKKINIK